jgi:hypothetical protein
MTAVRATAYPDAWALSLRLKVDGHPFDMRGREFQQQIIRDESPWIVMPKGAQLGLTTIFLVRTFHWLTKRRWKHLYLLPLKAGAVPFVQGRVDPVIESNKVLEHQFSSVDNRLHKQTRDKINLYFRGTNIWTELREVPADVIVFDERDKMVEENIPEAMARLDGSLVSRVVELSTPTVPGHGVDSDESWGASDQHRWFVRCPYCARTQTFTVDENVVIGELPEECFLRCSHCHKKIDDKTRVSLNETGFWVAQQPDGAKRGYHISQLNSPTKTISGFMQNYFDGQKDGRKMRAWWNNNRGEAYAAAGDKFTVELLDKCRDDFHLGGIPGGSGLYIGVDQGNLLHVSACFIQGGKRIKWQMKLFGGDDKWVKLDDWLSQLTNFTCVIDAHPEKTKASDLAMKYHGRVFLGFEKDRPDQSEMAVFSAVKVGDAPKVNIDRTAAFDAGINSYLNGNTRLPKDAREIGEHMPRLSYNGFYHHMIQQARKEEEDTNGRIIARWVKNKNPDHWHHADMFEYVATMREPAMVVPPGVGEIFTAAGGVMG